jgi:spermidine synthase
VGVEAQSDFDPGGSAADDGDAQWTRSIRFVVWTEVHTTFCCFPHGPSKMLYTREYYQLCKKRLTPGGLLSIHTDNYYLFPESFATIRKTLGSVFPHIATARVDMPCFGMGWTYRIASPQPISVARIHASKKRLQKAGHNLKHMTPSLYTGEPTGEELDVLKKLGRVSTDRRPFDKFERLQRYVTGKR